MTVVSTAPYILAILVATSLAKCPPGAFVGPQADCYVILHARLHWLEANDSCASKGGQLVSIRDRLTNDFLSVALRNNGYGTAWIGANNLTGRWTGSEGSPLDYTNWRQGEPRAGARFATMTAGSDKWLSDNDDLRRPLIQTMICSVPARAGAYERDCPTGTITGLSDRCYSIGYRFANWTNAERVCTTRGGHLASVHDNATNELLTSLVNGTNNTPKFWLGATGYNGEWNWSDGTAFTFSNWASVGYTARNGTPMGAFISGCNCTMDDVKYVLGRWYTWTTSKDLRYICETPHPCRYRLVPFISHDAMNPDDVCISESVLGRGAFASVYVATINDPACQARRTVAAKVPHNPGSATYRFDILREIGLMYDLVDNVHILRLVGHTFLGDAPVLILEFCERGDLLTFLQKELSVHKNRVESLNDMLQLAPYQNTGIAMSDLVRMCWQISDGMAYLAAKRYVHRDLAARNILLLHDLTCKIADFGLCRCISTDVYESHRDAKLPVRWSFGVVLYEIFSAGDVPYKDVSPLDVLRCLKSGYRMEQPALCPDDMYELMLGCWDASPERRPSFDSIRRYVADNL